MLYNCFFDFQKSFDSIQQEIIRATFRSHGMSERLVQIFQNIGGQSVAAVRIEHEIEEWFATTLEMRKGDP